MPDAPAAAARAATHLEQACREACTLRGRAVIAVSGGTTPWPMLQAFARAPLPWDRVHVTQIDERCVARDDPRRNLASLRRVLVQEGPLPASHLLELPVDDADPVTAMHRYATALAALAGADLALDVVQLGLGADGHTASLVPDDPVLDERAAAVARTARLYEGTQRMTLTYPVLGAARQRLWLVTGAAKTAALAALLDGTGPAPAVRVRRDATLVIADRAAAGDRRSPGD